jgi:hypothetical protein
MEEKTELELEQRMYVLVLYNLKPIQQGIQAAHAVVEYERAFAPCPEYYRWAGKDKTLIILDGGTSKTIHEHRNYLVDNDLVKVGHFNEPDLYNGMTAFCFLVDERIWNRKKYLDPRTQIPKPDFSNGISIIDSLAYIVDIDKFKESIGGEKNFMLREYLNNLRLA